MESLLSFARATAPQFEMTKVEELLEETLKYFEDQINNSNIKKIAVHKKNYKLIGDVDTEILPDDTYSGILLFPRLIGGDPEMIIKFYEFITKVDAGGTPTERTNFEFKFKLAEASEWFNRNENKWEIGTPSSTVEYYDKKQKIWVLGKPE